MEQKFLFRVSYDIYRISKETKTKTYSSIRNDFQYFVRSIKGHLIFYDIYRISKEAKMRTYSSIRNDFQYFVRSIKGHLIFFIKVQNLHTRV
jgi:DNA-binding cell septation regulator SpoVG